MVLTVDSMGMMAINARARKLVIKIVLSEGENN